MPSAVIIGAGPAGSVAAILLRRAAWDVTIIEQHRFPREKVCGECLSALGLDVLRRNQLLDKIKALAPAELRRATLCDRAGRVVRFALPTPMWGISRAAMDHALLNAARLSGATVLQPWRCEAIEPRLVVRDLQSNRTIQLRYEWLLLADGKSALSTHRPSVARDMGIRAHFSGVDAPGDAVQLFGVQGHYGGIAPIENGLFNVALSVPAGRVAACGGDLRRLLAAALESSAVYRQFRSATQVGHVLASPLPRFAVRQVWPHRTIPIGNAAAAIEPIGGEGMGLAMRSAELATHLLINAQAGHASFNPLELLRQYQRLWSSRALICRLGGKIMSSPSLAVNALELLSANDMLLRSALHLAGKSLGT